MAGDYPGLPNWGYGAHVNVGLQDVLGLLPNSPQRKLTDAQLKKLEAETATEGKRGALLGAQTQSLMDLTPLQVQQLQSQIGLTDAQTERLYQMLPYEQAEATAAAGASKATAAERTTRAKLDEAESPTRVKANEAAINASNAQSAMYNKQPTLEELKLMIEFMNSMGGMPTPAREATQSALMGRFGVKEPPPKGPTEQDKALFGKKFGEGAAAPEATVGSAFGKSVDAWAPNILKAAMALIQGRNKQPQQQPAPQPVPQQPTAPAQPNWFQQNFMPTNFWSQPEGLYLKKLMGNSKQKEQR